MTYNKRIFGAAIIKAVNSNYNADFSRQPRTLPNGTVYATDKAFKYAVKKYLKDVYADDKIFYFKTLNNDMNPLNLDERYVLLFGEPNTQKVKKGSKQEDEIIKPVFAKNLLECLDVRLFGATYAGMTNISIHGCVQINHGENIWHENNIFSEQIMSPFRNPSEKSNDAHMTTLGRQSKLQEGHYLHHFSVNPKNLHDVVSLAGDGAQNISEQDITKLKEAMGRGVTWYDSASKAGSENEALIWITLKENSKLVLPNLTQLVTMAGEKQDGKVVLDCEKLKTKLDEVTAEVESIEIVYNKNSMIFKNEPQKANLISL